MAGADRIILTITGKSAHGATPHRGVDPILVTAQVLNHIQGFLAQRIDARSPKILTFGRIQGGNRFNILADEVTLEGSLRYLQESVRQEVLNGLRRQFAGLTQATGAENQAHGGAPVPHAQEMTRKPRARRCRYSSPCWGRSVSSCCTRPWGVRTSPTLPPGRQASTFSGVRTPGGRGQVLHSPS